MADESPLAAGKVSRSCSETAARALLTPLNELKGEAERLGDWERLEEASDEMELMLPLLCVRVLGDDMAGEGFGAGSS